VETSQHLFKELEVAEKLFSDGSIKNAQKKVRNVFNESKKLKKIPNKLRHKINAAINKSKYFDEISLFATNPKRNELINKIKELISKGSDTPKKQAHSIHEIQRQWQLLDISSKAASKNQWLEFNELTNKAWEPCKDYFDEINKIKINNADQRKKIIDTINLYVENNQKKWPSIKELASYLRGVFEDWQSFAPVMEKDLNQLKSAYFEARKPINDEILRQEKNNRDMKESLISKVDEINNDDNEVNISKFKELKFQWQKIGPAGRKADTKLWNKFNKNADRFFEEKKQAQKNEIQTIKDSKNNFISNEITLSQLQKEVKELKNIKNTKELKEINNFIKNEKEKIINEQRKERINKYNNIYKAITEKDLSIDVPNTLIKSIEKSFNNKKSNMDELLYSCVKLELLANLDSNKKDENLRKTIQLEFLTNKFNKSYKNNTNDLESILINFIDNCSAEDLEADHKKLWKRIYKCLEVII
tara:strand:- start:6448 stop:7872 length:1425 start_codon:yes stop_codon:yes gene_type:complete